MWQFLISFQVGIRPEVIAIKNMFLASFGSFPFVLSWFWAGLASRDGSDICGQQPMTNCHIRPRKVSLL